jgi:hypothetical protein
MAIPEGHKEKLQQVVVICVVGFDGKEYTMVPLARTTKC